MGGECIFVIVKYLLRRTIGLKIKNKNINRVPIKCIVTSGWVGCRQEFSKIGINKRQISVEIRYTE